MTTQRELTKEERKLMNELEWDEFATETFLIESEQDTTAMEFHVPSIRKLWDRMLEYESRLALAERKAEALDKLEELATQYSDVIIDEQFGEFSLVATLVMKQIRETAPTLLEAIEKASKQ